MAWLEAPRPIRLYRAGSGPRMLAAAGRLGDGVMMYAGTPPDILRGKARISTPRGVYLAK